MLGSLNNIFENEFWFFYFNSIKTLKFSSDFYLKFRSTPNLKNYLTSSTAPSGLTREKGVGRTPDHQSEMFSILFHPQPASGANALPRSPQSGGCVHNFGVVTGSASWWLRRKLIRTCGAFGFDTVWRWFVGLKVEVDDAGQTSWAMMWGLV